MKLKTVRARQGLQWVRGGFRVFFRQPLGLSAMFAAVAFGALMLLQLPLLGPVLALGLMPLASIAFMIATRQVEAGHNVHPGLLLQPLRAPAQRRALLQLGGVYAAAAIAVVLLAHLVDGGRFAAAVQAMAENEATPELLSDPMLEFGVLLRLVLMTLLSLVFWHAPALVFWENMPVGKALFASMLACLRSVGAFALYGLAWFGLLLGFLMVTQTVLALLGLSQVVAHAALPAMMLFSTVFYASLWFSYADSFQPDHPDSAPAGGT
ncbi:MAG: hypothetical protein H0W40_12070 [Methylibium sp.]|uniref:BPSS1780 family membrane protein n=1 Tax=Methylibium sp. TaxID=2067992 RepID=UPI001819EF6C|nr:BPSS1780 family membrane protein [Methylibium sp.]MBA3598094.1 hypothetical protein [Methylibium sp.]